MKITLRHLAWIMWIFPMCHRAIFSDSPILILDEATSALDADTERKVLENIKSMTDKTVIIVTHRPAALAVCDRQIHFGEEKEHAKRD